MPRQLFDIPWDTLIGKIRSGYCTPVLGAGASYPSIPLASVLAKDLLDEFGRACPIPDRASLAGIVEFLSVEQGDRLLPKLRIADYINKRPVPAFEDPMEPHRMLADLALPLYITTNYDDFMVGALGWRQHHARPGEPRLQRVHQDYCRWTDKLLTDNTSIFDRGFRITPSEPVVFGKNILD